MAANPYYSRHDYCKIIVIVIPEAEVETFFIHTTIVVEIGNCKYFDSFD